MGRVRPDLEKTSMEALMMLVAVAALVLLAVAAMRYGVDSRDGFPTKERELAGRGLVWGGAATARDRTLARELRDAHDRRMQAGCLAATC